MMKKTLCMGIALLYILLVACGQVSTIGLNEEPPQDARTVEIIFDYQAQFGSGSNQFAVWIEDMDGEYINTVYVTNFTGNGGYAIRNQSLPEWVDKANAKDMESKVIHAITGATPQSGPLSYSWDCTNQSDNTEVPEGEYRYFLEANLYNENRVIYSGTIQVGDQEKESEATPEYFGEDENAPKQMIQNVRAKFVPKGK